MATRSLHIPVLFGELIGSLHFFDSGENIIVDCTLGLGGHASEVISRLGKGDIFIGVDCDATNLASARENLFAALNSRPSEDQPIVYCIHANFSELKEVIENIKKYTPINDVTGLTGLTGITSVYADLGVSSVHFDTPERGFSFRFDGPLDMRLDSSVGIPASELVNTYSFEKIAEILRVYGDEPRAGFIAKKIVEARAEKPIMTTFELAEIVKKAWKNSLTTVFQALRIAVNDEYSSIAKMLRSAHDLLISGGTISIISFHSGEDRIVKNFFRDHARGQIDEITGHEVTSGTLETLTKKPVKPSEGEIAENPRARSALLRVAKKI